VDRTKHMTPVPEMSEGDKIRLGYRLTVHLVPGKPVRTLESADLTACGVTRHDDLPKKQPCPFAMVARSSRNTNPSQFRKLCKNEQESKTSIITPRCFSPQNWIAHLQFHHWLPMEYLNEKTSVLRPPTPPQVSYQIKEFLTRTGLNRKRPRNSITLMLVSTINSQCGVINTQLKF